MENYFADERGFYGEFGGAYVPEILYKCVHDLYSTSVFTTFRMLICPSSRVQSSSRSIMLC